MCADRDWKWSYLTVNQLEEHTAGASRVLKCVGDLGLHPFAAGMGGALLIRNAIDLVGGRMEWWRRMIDPANNVQELLALLQLPGGLG